MILIKTVLHFFIAALAILIAVLCLHADINLLHNGLGEISITEIVQEIILAIIVVLHFRKAYKTVQQRICNVLIGGFFLTMLIRELDGVFDLIAHGSWFWFALFFAALTLIYALRRPQIAFQELRVYTAIPAYGIMFSGLLAILVFSRFFGMSLLWHSLLQDGYMRAVKNMVEEGSELFGYILCLISSILYLTRRE